MKTEYTSGLLMENEHEGIENFDRGQRPCRNGAGLRSGFRGVSLPTCSPLLLHKL